MPRVSPWLLWSVLLAAPAFAHDADVIYANLEAAPDGALRETMSMTGNTLALLVPPIDGDHDDVLTQADLDAGGAALKAGAWDDAPLTAGGTACARSSEGAALRDGFVELWAEFRCNDGELCQDFRFLRVLPANYRVVLGTQLDTGSSRAFAQGSLTSVTIARPGPPSAWTMAGFESGLVEGLNGFFNLGVLGALGCLGLSFRSWRRALQGLVPVVLSLAALAFAPISSPGTAALLLAVSAVGCALLSTEVPLAYAAALGGAIGLSIAGQGAGSEALGCALGLAALLVPALIAATAVGQLLRRRRWDSLTRWVLALAVCFAAGVRAMAW